MCLWWWCVLNSGSRYSWLENQAAQNLWPGRLLLITCKAVLQDLYYSRPSSRLYGHFRYPVMSFSSFPRWRAIRIDVGIRRRYILILRLLMSWLHSSSSFGWVIMLTWSRQVTITASLCTKYYEWWPSYFHGKYLNGLGILVNHSLFGHHRFYALRVAHSTSALRFRVGRTVKRMLIPESHQAPLTPLPSQKVLYA